MIEGLTPYPEYKESGSRWLGRVPKQWEVRSLRTLISRRNERNRPDLPLLSVAREKGVFVRSLTGDDDNHNVIPEDLTNYKVARAGNLVINKMKAWQGSMGIAPCDGIVSPAYFVFDFRITNRAFGQALLRSKPYVAHFAEASDGVRVGQWDLSIPGMRQVPILVPSEEEQSAIVRFLDHATRRIDAYIRTKRKLIALLNEQKQAIIHRAVTRGLDPDVKMKDSGVPWLGEVPEHWEVRKIRAISYRVTKGTTPTTMGKSFVDHGIRFVKVESISNNRCLLLERCAYIDEDTDALLSRSRLKAGDVVVAIAGAIGRVAVVAQSDLPANCNQAVAIISPNARVVLSDWLAFTLASPECQRVLSDSSVQSAQANLSLGNLRATIIPLPPIREQEDIVAFLGESTGAVAEAIARTEHEITLLREYRTRLIADVVTGQLDVRKAAKSLPDELPDEPTALEDDPDGDTLDEDAPESE